MMEMNKIKKEKTALRKEILKKRDSLSVDEAESKSLAIKNALFDLKEYKDAKNVMLFVSFRSEVLTYSMIREALADGKNISLPLVEKPHFKLRTYFIKDFNTDLEVGAYDILEPKVGRCRRAKKDEIDIVILPGSAFTKKGDRLGYGAGYYDRFLDGLPETTKKIALSFDLQIVDDLPVDENDVSMDMIITESRVINCKG